MLPLAITFFLSVTATSMRPVPAGVFDSIPVDELAEYDHFSVELPTSYEWHSSSSRRGISWSPNGKFLLLQTYERPVLFNISDKRSVQLAAYHAGWGDDEQLLVYGAPSTYGEFKHGVFAALPFSKANDAIYLGETECPLSDFRPSWDGTTILVISDSCCGVCEPRWTRLRIDGGEDMPSPASIWLTIPDVNGQNQEEWYYWIQSAYLPEPPNFHSIARRNGFDASNSWAISTATYEAHCKGYDVDRIWSPDGTLTICRSRTKPGTLYFIRWGASASSVEKAITDSFVGCTNAELHKRAEREYANGNKKEAQRIWAIVLTRNPYDVLALNNLGFSTGDQTYIEAAIELSPKRAVAWLNEGDVLYSKANTTAVGDVLSTKNYLAGAIQAYRQYLHLKPKQKTAAEIQEKINASEEILKIGGSIWELQKGETTISISAKGFLIIQNAKTVERVRIFQRTGGCNCSAGVNVQEIQKPVFGTYGLLITYCEGSRGHNCDGGCGAGVETHFALVAINNAKAQIVFDSLLGSCWGRYWVDLTHSENWSEFSLYTHDVKDELDEPGILLKPPPGVPLYGKYKWDHGSGSYKLRAGKALSPKEQ